VNQGRVEIMLPGIMRDNPDYYAVLVMNDILGGGGFTSHIMSRVRSDEGLAYSAYSAFPGGAYFPSIFTAAFQSKSRTVSYATSIVFDELRKMAAAPPTATELATSKKGYIDRFPNTFASKGQVAAAFAQDEVSGRFAKQPDFWKNFRARIGAVTAEDVQRVAKKYLTPDRAVILIVGNKSEILLKLPDHPVELKDLTPGRVTDVPLRDPMTMKPLPVNSGH
jgi:zinc protease